MKKLLITILIFIAWNVSQAQGIIPGYNFVPHYTTAARPAAAAYNKYCVIFNDDSIGTNPIQVSTGSAWITLGAAIPSGGLTNPMSAVNDMIFGGTAGAPARLPAPAHNGMKLSSTGGTLAWQDTTAGGGVSGLTAPFVPYATSATTLGNSTASFDGTDFKITNAAGTRASHFYSSGTNIFLRASIVALADSDATAFAGIGTTTQLNSGKLNVTGVSTFNGALWLGNATGAGFRLLQNSTLMRFDCETTNEDITFTTGLVAKNNLFLSHTGNSIFNNTAENGTAILQSQSNSTTQFALHYDATNYGQEIVNSAGSWGFRHMTGFTLPAAALAQGTSSDSVLAIRTSSSGIDTVVKVLFPSGGGVSSVSNSDGTLTISPTTGAVVASLALGHANTWSALQTFGALTTTSTTIMSGLTSAGANDSIVTQDPATGTLHRRSGTLNLKAANGLFAPTTDSLTINGSLNQPTQITLAGFPWKWNGVESGTGQALVHGADSAMRQMPLGYGSYVPTLGNVTNVTSSTPDTAIWTRTGNTVTVGGSLSITPTSGSTSTQVTISLPVASTLAGGHACWGAANTQSTGTGGAANTNGEITTVTGGVATLTFITSAITGATIFRYIFIYQVQ
jgi:hypothetical protein